VNGTLKIFQFIDQLLAIIIAVVNYGLVLFVALEEVNRPKITWSLSSFEDGQKVNLSWIYGKPINITAYSVPLIRHRLAFKF